MNWISIVWLMAIAACLTLALIHLQITLAMRGPNRRAHLFFTLSAVSVAIVGAVELVLLQTDSLARYQLLMRWAAVPLWMMFISLTGFTWFFLSAGRRWLALAIVCASSFTMIANLLAPLEGTIRYAVSIRTAELGGAPFTLPTVRNGLLTAIEILTSALLITFVVDASRTAWRRGDRRQAAMVGGGIIFFLLSSRLYAIFVEFGAADTPFFFIVPFLALLGAMGRELSLDVFRAADLASQLRESEQRMDMAARSSALGFWVWDIARDELWATHGARALFGVPLEEKLTYGRFASRLHPEDRESVRRAIERALDAREDYETEYRVPLPDGGMRWISARGRAEYGADGKPVLMRGVVFDVTSRRSSESELQHLRGQLAHAGRVSIMGQLASALAHELNQPLGAILSNADAAELFLQSDPPAYDEVRAILADIRKDDQRAGEVISRMRRLLKHREMELSPLELSDVIAQAVTLVRPDATSRNIVVDVDVDDNLPRVQGDWVHLQQVLLNLMINGMDAMSGMAVDRRLTISARRLDAGTVQVAVSDSGHGIPADKLEAILEPFYTTKSEGMGMGLPISKTIVEAHGGRMWAGNNAGRGATLHFTLRAL